MSENEEKRDKSIIDGVQWHDSTLKSAVQRMEAIVAEQQARTRIDMFKLQIFEVLECIIFRSCKHFGFFYKVILCWFYMAGAASDI